MNNNYRIPYRIEVRCGFVRFKWKDNNVIADSNIFVDYRLIDSTVLAYSKWYIIANFSARERQVKLLEEIDLALNRIENGEYGYCEITGDDIGLKRLESRPIATQCIEAQEQFERLTISRVRAAII